MLVPPKDLPNLRFSRTGLAISRCNEGCRPHGLRILGTQPIIYMSTTTPTQHQRSLYDLDGPPASFLLPHASCLPCLSSFLVSPSSFAPSLLPFSSSFPFATEHRAPRRSPRHDALIPSKLQKYDGTRHQTKRFESPTARPPNDTLRDAVRSQNKGL